MERTVEQVMQLGDEIVKVSSRITALERDASFITDFLSLHNDDLVSRNTEMDDELAKIRKILADIETNLKNATITFDVLVSKLKDTAQKNALDKLSERVDAWNPERFVTKYELNELLKE